MTDREARLASLDPAASFIVQAPAGSGKTELLIQRFLTLLATVDHPESIVAVTFTRKAAGEMRHRVVDALRKASDEPAPEKEHELQTWELCRHVLARDRELGWQLIEHPSRLRIQTIDSFCGMLVQQMPWLSRMGAGTPPEEKAEYLYRMAARDTIELLDSPSEGSSSRVAAIERLLKHLDNNLGTVENLLTGMLRSRDHWLRHIVPNMHDAGLRQTLQSAVRQIIEDELETICGLFPLDILAETIALANFAARNLAMENPEGDLAGCVGLNAIPGTGYQHLRLWRGLAELFLTKDGGRRKTLTVKNGFPPKPDCKAEKVRCLSLELPADFADALQSVRALPPDDFSDGQWEVLSALTELLPVAAAQLKVVFQREGKVDFTEIAQAAAVALGPPDNPTDLAFSLDCRIQHLLVDEFQDTSHGQYALIEKLTAEWQPGDGRSLFLVGDPMQSIYGFREAEVALFLKARDQGIGNIPLTPLELSVNFRSSAGIVSWVNTALGEGFPTEEDMFRGAVPYRNSVAFDAAPGLGAVNIHPFFDKDPEQEALAVVSIIQRARLENPNDSIAVLVRARTHLPAIVKALRAANEKFMAVEIDRLGERSVVQDLLALTAALLQPADRTAWLALLRAPWCGLTLADLHALAGADYEAPVWDLMNADISEMSKMSEMSNDGRERLDRVKSVMAMAIAERGRLPLRRWIEATWMELGGPACLESATGLEDAAVYFDLLESSATGADLRDAERFIGDVAGLFARPDTQADSRLQLLTIHKAKGLEFDTVILPGLGRSPRSEDPRLLLWLEYVDREENTQLLLAPIKESGAETDRTYAYVRKIQAAKSGNESMRLLYVAATRARSRLHLLGHTEIDLNTGTVKEPDSRTLLRKFWPAAAPVFEDAASIRSGTGAPADPAATPVAVTGVPLRRLSVNWRRAEPPPDIPWQPSPVLSISDDGSAREHVSFDWATELQRRVGIVVHAILQQADETYDLRAGGPAIHAALMVQGFSGDRLREATSRVEKALQSTVSDARGRWILRSHQEDQREYGLCGLVGGRIRHFTLDRTFVDEEGVRWIIDYKTGSHEGGNLDAFLNNEQERYRSQLENYASLMSRMDSRPIRLGLYFPLLQAWREWAV